MSTNCRIPCSAARWRTARTSTSRWARTPTWTSGRAATMAWPAAWSVAEWSVPSSRKSYTPATVGRGGGAAGSGTGGSSGVELGAGQLTAGGQAQLPEHLAQVVVDGVRAQVELGRDLGVGGAARGQLGHLRLLGGEGLAVAGGGPDRHRLPGRGQLAAGAGRAGPGPPLLEPPGGPAP